MSVNEINDRKWPQKSASDKLPQLLCSLRHGRDHAISRKRDGEKRAYPGRFSGGFGDRRASISSVSALISRFLDAIRISQSYAARQAIIDSRSTEHHAFHMFRYMFMRVKSSRQTELKRYHSYLSGLQSRPWTVLVRGIGMPNV